jgi:hypothetical protein
VKSLVSSLKGLCPVMGRQYIPLVEYIREHPNLRHSGMVRKHQTSDVQLHIGEFEIPGSMLRIAPE